MASRDWSQVPVLDLQRSRNDEFAAELGRGFSDCGFVAIRGHGIPQGLLAELFEVTRRLFELPAADKAACTVEGGAGQRGFTPLGIEHARDQRHGDLKEFWHVGRELAEHPVAGAYPQNVWPPAMPELRPVAEQAFAQLEQLGVELLRSIAGFLDLEASWFDDKVQHGNSILRLAHYPPVGDARGIRAAAHEDIDVITLLVATEQSGLEILSREERWVPVESDPELVVVNVGDMLQRLSNGILRSTTHRVVNPPSSAPDCSRYSAPFFLHFNADFTIHTLPSCINRVGHDRYPDPITAHDYLTQRLTEIGLGVP